MKVRILRNLVYSDFGEDKVGAKRREVGEVVDFPGWYAESIIASGHVEPMGQEQPEPEARPRRKRKG